MSYSRMTCPQFVDAVARGQIVLEEFYVDLFAELARLDARYNFFITIAEDRPEIRKGAVSGLPVSVKDNICTQGIQTTAGSRILQGYVPR